jgi:hypothetical protein
MRVIAVATIALLAATCTMIRGASACSEPSATVIEQSDRFIARACLSTGTIVEGISFRKERLGGQWLVEFRSHSGMVVLSRSHDAKLRWDEFVEVLNLVANEMVTDGLPPANRVHVDLSAVEPVTTAVLRALREHDIPSENSLRPNMPELDAAALRAISTLGVVEEICAALASDREACGNQSLSMNPLAFESEKVGWLWSDVKQHPDAGLLLERLWFAVSLPAAK